MTHATVAPNGAPEQPTRGKLERTLLKMDGDLTLSFIMIAYNEAARIERSLKSILEQENLPDHEIIVVDDGSSDTTRQIVEDAATVDSHIILCPLDTNSGRGAARNAGVQMARGDYIAMVDADILLPKDWWEKCRIAVMDYDAVCGIAVPDGDVVYLADRLHLEPKAAPAATAISGSNAVFRREVFRQVRYETDLRNGEDVALSYAMQNYGLTTFVIPDLMVRHQENKTLLQTVSWLFESGIGASRQFETYREIRRPDLAAAFLIALTINALTPRRGDRRVSVGLLLFALLAVAASHVRTKFAFHRNDPFRYAAGVIADALLIASYVCGRIVGHGYVCRQTTRS